MTSPLRSKPRLSPEKAFAIKSFSPQRKGMFNFELADPPSRKDSGVALPQIKQTHSLDVSRIVAKESSKVLENVKHLDELNSHLDELNSYYVAYGKDDPRPRKESIKSQLRQKYSFFDYAQPKTNKKPSGDYSSASPSPVRKERLRGPKLELMKLVKGSSVSPVSGSPIPAETNASLLQRSHVEVLGKFDAYKSYSKRSSIMKGERYVSESPNKKEGKWQAYDYLHNFNSYIGSSNATLGNDVEGVETTNTTLLDNKSNLIIKIPSKDSVTLPLVTDSYSPENCSSVNQSTLVRKKTFMDPFSDIVKYQDGKMPFYLALNAETRQKMLEEVKKHKHEKADLNSLIEIKDQQIPQAQAKIIDKMTNEEVKKKQDDLKSRGLNRNALYQLYALDKNAQKKVRSKLQLQFADSSRFLKP